MHIRFRLTSVGEEGAWVREDIEADGRLMGELRVDLEVGRILGALIRAGLETRIVEGVTVSFDEVPG